MSKRTSVEKSQKQNKTKAKRDDSSAINIYISKKSISESRSTYNFYNGLKIHALIIIIR